MLVFLDCWVPRPKVSLIDLSIDDKPKLSSGSENLALYHVINLPTGHRIDLSKRVKMNFYLLSRLITILAAMLASKITRVILRSITPLSIFNVFCALGQQVQLLRKLPYLWLNSMLGQKRRPFIYNFQGIRFFFECVGFLNWGKFMLTTNLDVTNSHC